MFTYNVGDFCSLHDSLIREGRQHLRDHLRTAAELHDWRHTASSPALIGSVSADEMRNRVEFPVEMVSYERHPSLSLADFDDEQ